MKQVLIVIPARYASTRFPGKPLVKIAGVEMIKRVAAIAASLTFKNDDCSYVAAIDDERVADFCAANAIPSLMTSKSCASGTERCWDAVKKLKDKPELVINLQGDNPLCPPHVIQALIDAWRRFEADVFTPCIHLSWEELEEMLAVKKLTPASGTTVLVDNDGFAMAFSKAVIPMIRKTEEAKRVFDRSPVRRHIGLYAYSFSALRNYSKLLPCVYEHEYVEGLEQSRFLANGLKVKMVEVDYKGRKSSSGVDSPEDLRRVEQIIAEFGELEL